MLLKYNLKKHNAGFAITEHLVSTAVTFLLYKEIIRCLGIDFLGFWSILLSLISLTTIGTAGFANSAVKFVAKYVVLKDTERVANVIATTFITVVVLSILLLILIYILLLHLGNNLFSKGEFAIFIEYCPLLFVVFILGFGGSVFLASLDGLNLIYLRSSIGILSKLVFLVVSFFLIYGEGLKGVIIATLIQNVIILILAFFLIKGELKVSNRNGFKFDVSIFKEIFNYGYQFQIISIFQMLIDPLSKFLLKNFGGLQGVGYFELIYKFLFQARQLIVVGINTLLPVVASLQEKNKSLISDKFNAVFCLNFIVSIIILTGVFSLFPLLILTVGLSMNSQISVYSSLLYFGLLVNLFGVPSFTFNLGSGNLSGNLKSSVIMACLNLVLSIFLGHLFGSYGVVFGWMIAQVLSNVILVNGFLNNHHLILSSIIENEDRIVVLLVLLTVLLLYIVNVYCVGNQLFTTVSNLLIPVFLIYLPICKTKKFKLVKQIFLNRLYF